MSGASLSLCDFRLVLYMKDLIASPRWASRSPLEQKLTHLVVTAMTGLVIGSSFETLHQMTP